MSDVIYKYKVLILGPPAVGKTSLLHRFVNEEFKVDYHATIGATFLTKEIKISEDKADDNMAQLSLWDVGGQHNFIDLRTTFYRGANGALIVFDLIQEKTFNEIEVWQSEMHDTLKKDIPFVLIGNKSDLIKTYGRKVKLSSAKKFAKDKNSHYIETSAKTGLNVEKAFRELTRIIAEKEGSVDVDLKKVKSEAFFIKSKIRKYIKSEGYQTSNDLLDSNVLNEIIIKILDNAISIAKEDKRKTVQPKDIQSF
jgi:small GTP-binding protein